MTCDFAYEILPCQFPFWIFARIVSSSITAFIIFLISESYRSLLSFPRIQGVPELGPWAWPCSPLVCRVNFWLLGFLSSRNQSSDIIRILRKKKTLSQVWLSVESLCAVQELECIILSMSSCEATSLSYLYNSRTWEFEKVGETLIDILIQIIRWLLSQNCSCWAVGNEVSLKLLAS